MLFENISHESPAFRYEHMFGWDDRQKVYFSERLWINLHRCPQKSLKKMLSQVDGGGKGCYGVNHINGTNPLVKKGFRKTPS